ncbi:hypothetical protein RJ55_08658 [Drechmeria coniospora]|nr:hypothetical protein RJ55_08658 [Drechmeria coniospora]
MAIRRNQRLVVAIGAALVDDQRGGLSSTRSRSSPLTLSSSWHRAAPPAARSPRPVDVRPGALETGEIRQLVFIAIAGIVRALCSALRHPDRPPYRRCALLCVPPAALLPPYLC